MPIRSFEAVRGLAARVVVGLALSGPGLVFAQRTDDNVTAKSDDAFGRSVGNESIGIYNPGEVRGFSPIDAGNVRIEGLYFDQQSDPSNRLIDGSAIRVGIAAQSYPFPSPTGIVDYSLRRAGGTSLVSPVFIYGPYATKALELDAQVPIVPRRLSLAAGTSIYHERSAWGNANESVSVALMPEWTPDDRTELRPFFSVMHLRDDEPQNLMFTADGGTPPVVHRTRYFGQPWATADLSSYTYGVLGQTRRGAWTTRLGLFQSIYAPERRFADLVTDIQPDGSARELVVAFQDSRFSSQSGELRTSRYFEEGPRRHTLIFTARGRYNTRRYGGEDVIDAGLIQVDVGHPIAEPQFRFGPQSRDEVRQATGGVNYQLQWRDVGEASIGVQKTFYRKTTTTPDGALPESRDEPVLPNLTATVYATPRLAIYASYTEGLEESPVAPDNAVNRNVAAPALHTKQYDAGLRWAPFGDVRLITGVFNVEKPYFDLDDRQLFTSLGMVRHRGIEISLSGTVLPNLTAVAGTRFLDAEVSGENVTSGRIGRRPLATYRNYSSVSLNYAIPRTRLSFDATAESISHQVANTLNTEESAGRWVLALGGRYKFTIFDKPATLRAQMGNVFNRYGWIVVGGGAYTYNQPRRFSMYLAMDL